MKEVCFSTTHICLFFIIIKLLTCITKSYENLHALIFLQVLCINTVGLSSEDQKLHRFTYFARKKKTARPSNIPTHTHPYV